MSEFSNRVETQRDSLKVINCLGLYREPLFSLTGKAIDRWVTNNQIDGKENFVILIKEVSEKLFFLANKSQEQVTEDYQNLSKDVSILIGKIKTEMAKL
jgi:hypothetical protein